jgi:HAD superfamily hydrolase (TIGR01490 family)
VERPFAVFDIDGTLIRWQLYHAIADELARNGKIAPEAFMGIRGARMTWKNRDNSNSFNDYEQALIKVVDTAILGLSVSDLSTAAQAVINEYKDQVYTYTRDLISELRTKNYLLFIISASQSDIVKLLAEYYKFDDYGGSTYGVEGDHYTGEKVTLRRDLKLKFLEGLVSKHNASWQGSIAVGDSEGDIQMLEQVERPIAFNPTRELFDHAKEHNWPVVLERKNVIYKLTPDHGSYLLA